MASIRDLWFDTDDQGEKIRSGRYGCPKRWLVRWRDPTGKSMAKAFARKPDADAYKDNIAADVRRGDYIDPRAGRILFRTVAEQWRDARTVAATTGDRERGLVARLVDVFGDYPVAEIRPSMVRAWMAKRRKAGISASTLRQEMWALSAILAAVVDDDMIRKSPLAKIRRPAVTRRKVQPWSLEVIRGILEAHPANAAPVAWLGVGAGLRQSEAFAVGVDDVDWLRRELRVERQVLRLESGAAFGPPKRSSVGTVPLPVELVERLSTRVDAAVEVTLPWVADDAKPGETRTVRLLAVGRRGAAFRRDEYNASYWKPALAAAGVTPAGKATGHHMLRHCYASYLLAEGLPITLVQARLRHATLDETVRTYAHLVPDLGSECLKDAIVSLFPACYTPVPRLGATDV